MKKRVVDLTAAELEQFAEQAWTTAAQDALAQGFSTVGSKDGRLLRYSPDGRIEYLNSGANGPAEGVAPAKTATRKRMHHTDGAGTENLGPTAIGKPRAT
jgi:hypothetical protein